MRIGEVDLRPVEREDLEPLVELLADPALRGERGIPGEPLHGSSRARIAKEVEGWPNPEHEAVWVVEARGELVGLVHVGTWWDAMTPQIWVLIAPGHRRLGIGSAAAGTVLDLLFSATPAHTVQCWIEDGNVAGQEFATTMGFSPAGRSRRTGLREGAYHDTLAFDLLRREWEAIRADHR